MANRLSTSTSGAVSFLFIGLALVGCRRAADAQMIRIGGYQPRFIITFLDETKSRGHSWDTMRDKAALVVSRLKNKDAFTLIGIDGHGFDEDDVRIPVTAVIQPPNDIVGKKLRQARQELVQQVSALKPRKPEPRKTDIVGAIMQAAEMANKESRQRRIVLAFFSDMQQTPKLPTDNDLKDVKFPEGTEAHCFYVAASQSNDFKRTVDLWQRLLSRAGIRITANNFHQQGYVDQGVNAAFPQ